MADDKGETGKQMRVDSALVRELAELLSANELSEIEVEDGDRKIRVRRELTAAHPVAMVAAPAPAAAPAQAPAAAPAAAAADALPAGEVVRSPMVGTAYLSAEPGSKPFASPGDTVREGDTLLIVEAMKVMNPIVAPRAGKIVQVMVANAQPVEFDQPLFVIE
ncbi:acetyl-CoA carboxylase biotin carboxyl carrier protein [Sphingomonas sp. KRR8]|uniref:acetyl-CoA carboxylase biotin carboxyl carrier protein n=1 Tax=Sphingomonas sp. KRR8 TaxID=2942996 RepID=UPI002021FDAB|nr:acetyl-CoA carboxylase biotin carboxyl carrier protein [Sphingomonas sp. KRR8]URD60644.1 acetyl-CoA carboxylase biotin carboxyl carrier protein [Sphingomonas sp. KRR8]